MHSNKTKKELKRVLSKIDEEAKKFGLEINWNKTKYIIMKAKEKNRKKRGP